MAAIIQGIAIAVMDGSSKAQLGTVAFLSEGDNSHNRLVAVNQAPRYPDDQSLLQGELVWCYGVVSVIQALCKERGITQGSIKLRCKNIEALQLTVNLDYFITPNHKNFDLTTAIR